MHPAIDMVGGGLFVGFEYCVSVCKESYKANRDFRLQSIFALNGGAAVPTNKGTSLNNKNIRALFNREVHRDGTMAVRNFTRKRAVRATSPRQEFKITGPACSL